MMRSCLAMLAMLAVVVSGAGDRSEPRDSRPWPAPSAVMSRPVMCEPKKQAEIRPLRIAGVHWGGAIYPDEDTPKRRQDLTRQINMVHAAGAAYIGSINGRGLLFKGMDDEAVRQLDGSPLRHAPMNNAIFKCSLNPVVQAALLDTARRSISVGMDGLILDSWHGETRTLCFCRYCVEFYRKCLSEHRQDPRLRGLKDVEIREFDYGKYLRDKGFDASTPVGKLPFGPVFQEFRFDELLQRKRDLLTGIREEARRAHRTPFHLTANVYSLQAMTFAIDDLLDYFSVELPYFGSFNGYPPRCTSIALLKKAQAAGKRCVIQPGCHDTARALMGQTSTATLFKIWIAEAYANGHLFDLVPREFAGYEQGEVVWLDLPVRDLVPYYAFVQAHPEVFAPTTSVARVAVLYGIAAADADSQEYEREYQAVCKALCDTHRQFDVVLAGEGNRREKGLLLQDLVNYDLIIVIMPELLRSETQALLTEYTSTGGNLHVCGWSKTVRQSSAPASQWVPVWLAMSRERDVFSPYLDVDDERVRGYLSRRLESDRFLHTDAPATVGVFCARADKKTLVHLVNYNYSKDTDTVRSVENVNLTLRLSASQAVLLSPDGGPSRRLELRREGEFLSCVVPKLQVYSVVVLQ